MSAGPRGTLDMRAIVALLEEEFSDVPVDFSEWVPDHINDDTGVMHGRPGAIKRYFPQAEIDRLRLLYRQEVGADEAAS